MAGGRSQKSGGSAINCATHAALSEPRGFPSVLGLTGSGGPCKTAAESGTDWPGLIVAMPGCTAFMAVGVGQSTHAAAECRSSDGRPAAFTDPRAIFRFQPGDPGSVGPRPLSSPSRRVGVGQFIATASDRFACPTNCPASKCRLGRYSPVPISTAPRPACWSVVRGVGQLIASDRAIAKFVGRGFARSPRS